MPHQVYAQGLDFDLKVKYLLFDTASFTRAFANAHDACDFKAILYANGSGYLPSQVSKYEITRNEEGHVKILIWATLPQ